MAHNKSSNNNYNINNNSNNKKKKRQQSGWPNELQAADSKRNWHAAAATATAASHLIVQTGVLYCVCVSCLLMKLAVNAANVDKVVVERWAYGGGGRGS